MLYQALISFSGIVSMATGEIGEISDPLIADDLLKAGYIMPVEQKTETKPKKKGKKQ